MCVYVGAWGGGCVCVCVFVFLGVPFAPPLGRRAGFGSGGCACVACVRACVRGCVCACIEDAMRRSTADPLISLATRRVTACNCGQHSQRYSRIHTPSLTINEILLKNEGFDYAFVDLDPF